MNIEQEIKDLKSRVLELENIKEPRTVYGKIENLFQSIDSIQTKLTEIVIRMEGYFKSESSAIEEFTNEQIKNHYIASGLNSADVKDFIEKTFMNGETTTYATVSRYVNGEIDNLRTRSMLGKWLRAKSYEKNTKS